MSKVQDALNYIGSLSSGWERRLYIYILKESYFLTLIEIAEGSSLSYKEVKNDYEEWVK